MSTRRAAAGRRAASPRGSLKVESFARPGKLFTASANLIVSEVAALKPLALKEIVGGVVTILEGGNPVGTA